MWSKNYAQCQQCGTSERPHMAQGLCRQCYLSRYRSDHGAKIAQQKRDWYLNFIAGTDRGKLAREARNFDGQRQAVLERDQFKCTRCGNPDQLTVHHRDRKGRGSSNPNNDLSNLQTLCRKCHAAEHRAERMEKTRGINWKSVLQKSWETRRAKQDK